MAWQQLTVLCDTAEITEQMCDWLGEHALAVTVTDAADQPIYEPAIGSETFWDQAHITALFDEQTDVAIIAAALCDHLQQALTYRITPLADQAWERTCLDQFQPMQFGNRTWICPSWHSIADSNAVIIKLDPGLAFGTGSHPTTRLCMEWLDHADLTGNTVLDYGCGSGILAITAIKLGAQQAWACDIDPQALIATTNNAADNQLTTQQIFTALPNDLPAVQVDVVIANILAKPLIDLAPILMSFLKPGGLLMLSGILHAQDYAIVTAYQSYCDSIEIRHLDDWSGISGIKKPLP